MEFCLFALVKSQGKKKVIHIFVMMLDVNVKADVNMDNNDYVAKMNTNALILLELLLFSPECNIFLQTVLSIMVIFIEPC